MIRKIFNVGSPFIKWHFQAMCSSNVNLEPEGVPSTLSLHQCSILRAVKATLHGSESFFVKTNADVFY
jgi:hypothetical protein